MKATIHFLKSKPQSVVLILLLIFAGFSSCNDDSTDGMVNNPNGKVSYEGSFVKSSDQVMTSATGTVTATYDPTTLVLSYTLSWSGLGTNAVSMHFHDDGPVIVEINSFPGATSGTTSGSATLTSQQAGDLAAGKIYAQIHTVDFPGGEILATLSKSGSNGSSGGGGSDY